MKLDNEKLYNALDNIAYVNRKNNFMMLPKDEADERPFLLSQLKEQLDIAISEYCKDPNNAERVQFYGLQAEKWKAITDTEVGTLGMWAFG